MKDEYIMPVQPIAGGRFIPNRIVSMLLDTHQNHNMNTIAFGEFTNYERQQFAQLIGYSVSGYGDLSYVDNEAYDVANNLAIDTSLSETNERNKALRSQLDEIKTRIDDLYQTCVDKEI